MVSIKDLILMIDFGDIDGLYDPNLEQYFLDCGFIEGVLNKNTFFVIGRKGTGKSALYNYINRTQSSLGILVSNLSFKNFPFEKLLQLSDDSFSKPNQYQSIWRNIILTEYCRLIILDQRNSYDNAYKEISDYVHYVFGSDLIDLHKKVTKQAHKTSHGIGFTKEFLNCSQTYEYSNEKELADCLDNISRINERLEFLVRSYLKVHEKSRYIIQFDQLDDNYNVYSNFDSYFQSIISLFKSIYDLNQTFRSEGISSKTIAYIRSDIFYSINAFDAESARWNQFRMNLSWAIVNKSDWDNPRLKQMINKRIESSITELKDNMDPYEIIFNNSIIRLTEKGKPVQSIFKYMIHKSYHRPRDIIQFCINIQEQVKETKQFYFRTIKEAEKDYSLWLLSEIENEISPKIKDTESLYELLRLFGQSSYSIYNFKTEYRKFESKINFEPEALLKYLYSVGIIYNVNFLKNMTEVFSIIRNDRSVLNRDLKIVTHSGFYLGLYTSKYMKK